ncbi:MAG: hypothetical protein LC643_00990, partial [Bacteroidales bacterium]|nr:hypothetical protein [Bacteroidales bacterium]
MKQEGATEKIIQENFIKMKFLSWVMMGFAVFALILDFSNAGVWSDELIQYYLVLDVILALVSLAALVVFWGFKVSALSAKDVIVKSLIGFVLVWSAVITGLHIT